MINIVSLNGLCEESFGGQGNKDVHINKQVTYAKIIDWSGQTDTPQMAVLRSMSFGFDKNDTLYLSTIHGLHAVSLKDLEFSQQTDDAATDAIDVSNRP